MTEINLDLLAEYQLADVQQAVEDYVQETYTWPEPDEQDEQDEDGEAVRPAPGVKLNREAIRQLAGAVYRIVEATRRARSGQGDRKAG